MDKGNFFFATWNKLYDVDFLRKYEIRCKTEHYLNEDPWFTYQVILNAHSCHLLSDCTLFYTCYPLSTSGTLVTRGYLEKVARQYVQIQQLKSAYIISLKEEWFYCNLLVDIMRMSLYNAYRIYSSPALTSMLKSELVREILSVYYQTTSSLKGKNWKYLLYRLYFLLPMWSKFGLVKLAVRLNVKQKIHRWVHF